MALNLDDKLVIGVSSRALFDLEAENKIFDDEGLKAYSDYQVKKETEAKMSRNPKTNEQIPTPAKIKPSVKLSSDMKKLTVEK